MKKLIAILITFFSFTLSVSAADISTSITGTTNIDANSTFTITVNFTGNDVWGITAGLNYDTSKLELIESTGQSGFTATVGSNIVLDSTSGHNGTFAGVVLKFKGKEGFTAGQTTTISLSNVEGSTASSLLSGSGTSKTISVNIPKSSNNNLSSLNIDGTTISGFSPTKTTYDLGTTQNTSLNITATSEDSKSTISGTGSKTIDYGKNTYDITVTAENGSKKTYTITITRPDNRSSDNNLSSLSAKPLDLKFNKNTTNYSFTVENDVTSINIKATPSDSKATISGTGSKNLTNYVNTFNIIVTAENGTQKTYTIKVIRKDKDGNVGEVSKDNTLKSLSIEGYDIKFNKDTLEYKIEVDNLVNSINITAEVNDKTATYEIVGNDKFKVGLNVIKINVTAESGDKKTYTINVNKKSDAPTTTLKELDTTLENASSNEIIIDIKDENTILTDKILSSMKESKKIFTINTYEDKIINYIWLIDGEKITTTDSINTKITFTSENIENINKLTNYADSIYLNFAHTGNLPENTKIKIYVADRYENGDKVNIYYYNEVKNRMDTIEKKIEVKDGYIELELDHCSEYIITKALIQDSTNNTNFWTIVSIIELVFIVAIIILDIFKRNPLSKLINKSNKKRA